MASKYSIAVLPFVNMSSDKENEYFSDGITVEIINALAKIEGLHITARTSSFAFKNQPTDVREIGKRLDVALILEGSIRKSNSMVRITAQLTQSENGFQVWSDNWDRELEDIFILQDEIAALIAEKVNSNLEPPVPTTQHTLENTDALDAYLRAFYLLNTWDFSAAERMISLFEKAIELDPELIKAYIGLANASTWLGSTGYLPLTEAREKIESSIRKVLEMDPECPDIYMLLASQSFWMSWDIKTALQQIDKAVNRQPSSPDALLSRGTFLAAAGFVEEALDNYFQADRLDPYGSNIKSGIGMIYGYTNEDEKALEYIDANIKIAPYWDAQYMFKLESLCKLQRFEEAWEIIEYVDEHKKVALSAAELRAHYFASRGEKDAALEQMELMKLERKVPPRPGDPDSAFEAQLYLMLDEKDKALTAIEQAVAERAAPMLFHRLNNLWDPLREHPRYIQAMKAITYPEKREQSYLSVKKYSKSTFPSEQAETYIQQLNALMEEQRLWLNPTLNLSDLAEAMEVRVHTLSQLLNEYMGKNFYDYVNSFRLDHFLNLYKQPAYKHFKLLSLAYECGFNSKTTFNTFFRKTLNMTPSEYFKEMNSK